MHRAFFCVLLCLAAPAHAEFYRCIDPAGQSYFSDRPGSCSTPVRVRFERELIGRGAGELPPEASGTEQTQLEKVGIANDSTISEFFIPSSELIGQWSVIPESPEPVDPELRSKGLIDTVSRHYTRTRGSTSEACTVELWGFSGAETARRVAASLDLPNWKVLRSDEILVLIHGVLLDRGFGSRNDLNADCEGLGERTYERIARMR